MAKIKILLVDARIAIKFKIISFLARKDCEIIISDEKEFLNSYQKQKSDIVIFELRKLDYSKITIIKDAVSIFPEIKIISFLLIDINDLIDLIKQSGVKEIVIKKIGLHWKKDLLEKILFLTNKNVLNPSEEILSTEEKTSDKKQLNKIEEEILYFICKGLTAKEIGRKMNLPSKSIDRERSKIIRKTNTKNIVNLVVFAIKNGIVKLENIDPIIPYKH